MTCSCAKSSGGYHGERDTSGDTRQYLEDRVCTQRFDSPRKKPKCVWHDTRDLKLWVFVRQCVCEDVFGCTTEAQMVLKGNRCQTEGGVIWSCQNFVLRHSIRNFSKHDSETLLGKKQTPPWTPVRKFGQNMSVLLRIWNFSLVFFWLLHYLNCSWTLWCPSPEEV